MLTFKDLDWYVHNCREPYYNKYLDFSFAKDVPIEKLQTIFYNLTVGYALKATTVSEARLVLVDNTSRDIVGGCTLFEKEYEVEYEIAYFIIPKLQGTGLGTELVSRLLSGLKKSKLKVKIISSVVMNSNISSVKLLQKVGFTKQYEYDGRKGRNSVYTIDIDDVVKVYNKKTNRTTNKKQTRVRA